MTTKAECQHYAGECLRWATKANTEEKRQAFLEMADAWTWVALVQTDVPMQSVADANVAKRRIAFGREAFGPVYRAIR
jgi:hypothetical protein